jgi:hypothetical protein
MADVLELRNELIAVQIVSAEGARLQSLRCVRSGLEFLLRDARTAIGAYPEPGREVRFIQGAASGMDECLPTVAPCFLDGQQIPDHGDFWQIKWTVLEASSDRARMVADGFSRPLRFEKTVRLCGPEVWFDSCVTNIGDCDTAFLYAAHPLLAVERGDRIVLPLECRSLTLFDSRQGRLGRIGDQVSWPAANLGEVAETRVDILDGPEAGTAEMLYTDRLQQGWCGLYRGRQKQGIAIRFDTAKLPYMGLWICCGGWPEDAGPAPQYAFAPEPTTAPCGSLLEAIHQKAAVTLQPGGSFCFSMQLCVSEPGIELQAFTALHSK